MAPVKPMDSADKNPKTRPGVTGFVQKYNEEPGPVNDLNPDVVTEDSVLPTPAKTQATTPKAPRATKPRTKKSRG